MAYAEVAKLTRTALELLVVIACRVAHVLTVPQHSVLLDLMEGFLPLVNLQDAPLEQMVLYSVRTETTKSFATPALFSVKIPVFPTSGVLAVPLY